MSKTIFTNKVSYYVHLSQEYVKEGGNRCINPACKSKAIVAAGNWSTDDSYILFHVKCSQCQSTWDDVHTLVRAINIKLGSE